MTESSTIEIPSNWLAAASYLTDLRNRRDLTDSDWYTIVQWLRSTSMDNRSYLAGEVAAGMIRDLAPRLVKDRMLNEPPANEWQRRIREIIHNPRVDLTSVPNDVFASLESN